VAWVLVVEAGVVDSAAANADEEGSPAADAEVVVAGIEREADGIGRVVAEYAIAADEVAVEAVEAGVGDVVRVEEYFHYLEGVADTSMVPVVTAEPLQAAVAERCNGQVVARLDLTFADR
jgi:hypothetical protein